MRFVANRAESNPSPKRRGSSGESKRGVHVAVTFQGTMDVPEGRLRRKQTYSIPSVPRATFAHGDPFR